MENSLAQGDPAESWVQPKKAKLGDAIALVRIPRFGKNYVKPVYEGTTRSILQRGVGHYDKTAMPGEIGNFSMAGHRTTYGKPFSKIAELLPGDKVIIETADTYFVYTITDHQIVKPTDVAVVAPVPNEPGVEPTQALLTMTSCHPQFSSRERYIQHGVLERTYPRAGGLPPDVLKVAS
jgi:sortase A